MGPEALRVAGLARRLEEYGLKVERYRLDENFFHLRLVFGDEDAAHVFHGLGAAFHGAQVALRDDAPATP